jgi:Amidohydrolase family
VPPLSGAARRSSGRIMVGVDPKSALGRRGPSPGRADPTRTAAGAALLAGELASPISFSRIPDRGRGAELPQEGDDAGQAGHQSARCARIATIKSAQCIGLEHKIGSLTPGKEADVVLLRKTDINMRAAPDPIAAIVLHAGVANVDTVLVGGNIVKQHGKLTYGDLPRRLAELERSSERHCAGFDYRASGA